MVDAYGVPVRTFPGKDGSAPMTIAMRYTYLISPEGKVVKMWEVKDIQNHSADILASIEASKK